MCHPRLWGRSMICPAEAACLYELTYVTACQAPCIWKIENRGQSTFSDRTWWVLLTLNHAACGFPCPTLFRTVPSMMWRVGFAERETSGSTGSGAASGAARE